MQSHSEVLGVGIQHISLGGGHKPAHNTREASLHTNSSVSMLMIYVLNVCVFCFHKEDVRGTWFFFKKFC